MGRLFAAALILLIVSGCAKNRASRDGLISEELPLTVDDLSEIKEGELNHKRVLWQYKLYRSPKLQQYCNVIAADVAAVSTRPHLPYRIFLLDTDEVNIFGGPGGYIYITKGLFEYLRNEGELAGLIAHEITHVANYEYSSIPQVSRVKAVYNLVAQGSELAKDSGVAGSFGSGLHYGVKGINKATPMLAKKFSSDQEVETDEHAIESLIQAGYDPRDYQNFIERLAKIEMEDVGRFVVLLNTHPPFAERRVILDERIRRLNLEDGDIEFKKDLLSEVRQATLNAAPPSSIVFQPKFETRTVSTSGDMTSQSKQQEKMSDRKRMGTWF